MEYLFFIAIVLALVEYRDFKAKTRYRAIESQLKRTTRLIQAQISEDKKGIHLELAKVQAALTPLDEFVRQAHQDLGEVIKEVKSQEQVGLREVPYDTVEGL